MLWAAETSVALPLSSNVMTNLPLPVCLAAALRKGKWDAAHLLQLLLALTNS